jgi:hypothetical protein
MSYDPAKHHRRSIRLKDHDYSGGGLYFVTLCAHRDAGKIFAPEEVRAMVADEWESAAGAGHPQGAPVRAGLAPALPYIIMPDHFHALVRIERGEKPLGDVIGAFKSRVVHRFVEKVKAGAWPRFAGKIWHRNYYEMIVRTPEAEEKIGNYIRMNPWKCVQTLGNGLRGMGNPSLWNFQKVGVLCSRKGAPDLGKIPNADAYLGGFHSLPEKRILDELLERNANIILCPAWGLENVAAKFLPHLEANRMLVLEMKNRDGNLAAAEDRNRFVIQHADDIWAPCVTPGGMLDRLLKAPM